jgi:hypothetical protein
MLCCTRRRKRVHTESLNYTIRWKGNIKNDHEEIGPENITGLNFLSTVSIGGVLCVDTLSRDIVSQPYGKMIMQSLMHMLLELIVDKVVLLCGMRAYG